MSKAFQYISLIVVYLFYASIALLMKFTGLQSPTSIYWWLGFMGLVASLGIYALAWQQILKRVELGTAYMFKGVSLIFIMILLAICYGEPVTVTKIIGTCIIVAGIALYAKG